MAGPLLLLGIWLASTLGLFGPANGFLYDQLYRLQPTGERSSRVLLIEADGTGADWSPLLDLLLASGARPLVFGFVPDPAPATFYRRAAAAGVIFARRPVLDPDQVHGGHWQPLPAAAAGVDLVTGLLADPEPERGVYRGHWLRVNQFGASGDSPWRLAAGVIQVPEGASFQLNLRGGSARLFRLSLAHALDGGLVPELTGGRAVLVDLARPDSPRFFTPLGPLSPALYNGLALDSLLAGTAVATGGMAWVLGGILLVMVLGLVLFQTIPAQVGLWLGLGVALGYAGLAWAALHLANLWVPLAEVLTAHGWAFVLLGRYRRVQEDRRVEELVAGLDTRLSERVAPESFYQADDHWGYVANMVQQYFHLHRTIFLERVPGDHRLREIRAIGCSLADIDEKRRDYERTPYSTAIAELAPIRLDRTFLRRAEAEVEEVQYLVPLIFASDVLGFWALTVLHQTPEEVPEFLDLVANVAERMSELLHHRRRWRQQAAEQRDPLRALMRLEGARSPSQGLRTSVVLLEQRLDRLQEVFDTLPDCCILYDLFGRLVIINRHMEGLARQLALRPYERTVMELTAELTGQPLAEVQEWLRYVALRGGELTLPVFLADGRLFLLNLRSTQGDGAVANLDHQERHGLLFALEDVTRFKSIERLKNGVLERLFLQLRNDLTAIYLSVGLLREEDLPRSAQTQVLQALQDKLDRINPMLGEIQQQLAAGWVNLLSGTLARYPVDGLEPLRNALATLADEGTRSDVQIDLQAPQLMSLVLAAPDQLVELFKTVLRLLLDDARPGGRLTLQVAEEASGLTHYRLANTGLGLTPGAGAEGAGGNQARLRHVVGVAARWGGELTLTAEEGAGLRFDLRLHSFLSSMGLAKAADTMDLLA